MRVGLLANHLFSGESVAARFIYQLLFFFVETPKNITPFYSKMNI